MTTTVEWVFEAADPDAGLGEMIVHPCTDDTEPAALTDHTTRDVGQFEVEHATTYTCQCGATITITEQYPRSWFE